MRAEAHKSGITVHTGYLFGICVDKDLELEEKFRKLQGRVFCKVIVCLPNP